MNKEEIYDSQISPLMGQIIQICKANCIAMMADFAIPTEADDGLRCTTILPDESGQNDQLHLEALSRIRRGGRPAPMMITTENADGSKTVTAVI